jgi:hypothetical protein
VRSFMSQALGRSQGFADLFDPSLGAQVICLLSRVCIHTALLGVIALFLSPGTHGSRNVYLEQGIIQHAGSPAVSNPSLF